MSVHLLALLTGALAVQAAPPALPSPPAETAEAADDPDIVVQATRSQRRLNDEPLRVEVVDRDEIEEKILMRPGNIAMLLSETSGLRVQSTAPAIGAANIRVQGLDGRFTQLLADGLPLYGGQASSLGLLQIPPTDLGRVEVIKGAVSALYGASALGGVINLVSRRPGDAVEGEALLNATTQGGSDATAYLATPLATGIGLSLTGGWHRQPVRDLDRDGWIDIPGYRRWTIRPRLFVENDRGVRLFVTAGLMEEHRRGGTLPDAVTPAGTPFVLRQQSLRRDLGLVVSAPVSDGVTLGLRAAGTVQDHRHRYGDTAERDRHDTHFVEASLAGGGDATSWVGGVAFQRDDYHARTLPAFDYRYAVPGVFAQVDHDLTDRVTLAGSARLDLHNRFGAQLSPRLSLLFKPGAFSVRASAGRGFYAPTPFVEAIEAAGLSRLEPIGRLKVERATTATLDVGYVRGPWEANVTLFGSVLTNATDLVAVASDRVRLVNLAGDGRIGGVEGLLRWRHGPFVATATYVRLSATEPDGDGSGRRAKSLTPGSTAGLVGMFEKAGSHRIGIEAYYTGEQRVDNAPYRTRSRPYVELGLLAEKTLGAFRVFVNAENILNVRQTRYDPIVRRVRAPDGRWTVDAWAPTDGFVLNGGVRVALR